jgi:hypothetical protein
METTADGQVYFHAPCRVTGKWHRTPLLAKEAVAAFLAGALVQDAFPDLDPREREFLISGTSPEGWRQAFGYSIWDKEKK